jgi:hypothetical protein
MTLAVAAAKAMRRVVRMITPRSLCSKLEPSLGEEWYSVGFGLRVLGTEDAKAKRGKCCGNSAKRLRSSELGWVEPFAKPIDPMNSN